MIRHHIIAILICSLQLANSENQSESVLDKLQSSKSSFQSITDAITLANLSRAAYAKAPQVAEYQMIGQLEGGMGLEAVAFKKGDEIIVAFAGTNPKQVKDLATDAQALSQIATPSQFKQAAEYVAKLQAENPNSQIGLTGHSLGGQIALYVGGIQGFDAVAFNAPPPNAKMKLEIAMAKARLSEAAANSLALNFSSREGFASHQGSDRDMPSAMNSGAAFPYGTNIWVPAQGQGSQGNLDLSGQAQSLLSYHNLDAMIKAMEQTKINGTEEYQKISGIWKDIDSRDSTPQPDDLPGVDFKNRTTTGGNSPPMELPGVDMEKGTTTGGGGPPIPIPQIPPMPKFSDDDDE